MMNIQLFADETANATAGESTENGTAAEAQQNTTNGADAQTTPPRTYTEAEYHAMSSSQYAQGVAKVMKDAGYTPDKEADFKEQLKAFHKWQNDQKTDLERAQGEAAKVPEKDAMIARLEARFEAVQQGVDPVAADDIITLAERRPEWAEDKAAAIKAVVTQYPQFGASKPPNTTQMQNPAGASVVDKEFQDMTSEERLLLRKQNPTRYAQMRSQYLGV